MATLLCYESVYTLVLWSGVLIDFYEVDLLFRNALGSSFLIGTILDYCFYSLILFYDLEADPLSFIELSTILIFFVFLSLILFYTSSI